MTRLEIDTSWPLQHELRNRIIDDRVEVGIGTYGNPNIVLYSMHDRVRIGKFCSIAGGTTLLGGGEHPTSTSTTFPFWVYFGLDSGAKAKDAARIEYKGARYKGPINIGNDVWIGYGATILSGVTIGDGAVIGAGSLVSKDVLPYSITAGNPARHIRFRFSQETIDRLLTICWWDWPLPTLFRLVNELTGDPHHLFAAYDELCVSTPDAFRPDNEATQSPVPETSTTSPKITALRRFYRWLKRARGRLPNP